MLFRLEPMPKQYTRRPDRLHCGRKAGDRVWLLLAIAGYREVRKPKNVTRLRPAVAVQMVGRIADRWGPWAPGASPRKPGLRPAKLRRTWRRAPSDVHPYQGPSSPGLRPTLARTHCEPDARVAPPTPRLILTSSCLACLPFQPLSS